MGSGHRGSLLREVIATHDGELKAVCFGVLVVVAYGLYLLAHPTEDGIVFGTVMTMLGLIGGYVARSLWQGGQIDE